MLLLNDFNVSVKKAFDEIDSQWDLYQGLVVCGTHTHHDVEDFISKIKYARENKVPCLGICAGLQLMVIEYARNVLGITDATSEEFSEAGTVMIKKLPELRVGLHPVTWKDETILSSHWHNYAFASENTPLFEKEWNLSFTKGILEIMQLDNHPFFIGTQFHPEYESSRDSPHWLIKQFINICKKSTVGLPLL